MSKPSIACVLIAIILIGNSGRSLSQDYIPSHLLPLNDYTSLEEFVMIEEVRLRIRQEVPADSLISLYSISIGYPHLLFSVRFDHDRKTYEARVVRTEDILSKLEEAGGPEVLSLAKIRDLISDCNLDTQTFDLPGPVGEALVTGLTGYLRLVAMRVDFPSSDSTMTCCILVENPTGRLGKITSSAGSGSWNAVYRIFEAGIRFSSATHEEKQVAAKKLITLSLSLGAANGKPALENYEALTEEIVGWEAKLLNNAASFEPSPD